MKMASIRKITTTRALIDWMDNLPVYVSPATFKKVLIRAAHPKNKCVLWRRGLGFKFFK